VSGKIKKKSKIFVLKHKAKFIILAMMAVLFILILLIFDFLEMIFGMFLALCLCITSFVLLLRFISVVSTFPGSYWFYKRKV
jgi:uncharacterized membrane protein